MKNSIGINRVALLLVLLFPSSLLFAGVEFQSDWSGGPGTTGPTNYWFNDFSTQSQTSWTTLPSGKLLLDISTISHTINSSMGGCYFAFPADMDGDGDMDVLAQSTDYYDITWFENDGSGGGWNTHMVSDNYPLPRCAYPGDLDGDGDLDVAGANSASSNSGIEWFRNDDGVGDSWTRFYIDDQFGNPNFVCCTDINNDDTLEVIAPSRISPYQIAWWKSSTTPPDSIWEKHVVSSSSQDGWELFPVDLDQDGDMDILCANHHSISGLQFWENIDGVGTDWELKRINSSNDDARSVHAADIDGDSDLDVVACGTNYFYLSWFENLDDTCGAWEEHVLSTTLDQNHGVHAADVTDDGFVDILVAVWEDNQLFLYRNMDGTGMEWAVYLLKSGWWFEDVDVADFNDDGFTDILAGATDGVEVSWHEISGYSSGWLESSILDVVGYPEWDSIAWTAEEPAGTDLFFQIKSSNDWEDMGVWCDTIFEPGSLTGYIDSTHRYIQYRLGMTTESRFGTPVLDEVRFYWSSMGIEGGSGGEEFVITAVPNPSAGGVSIVVPSLYAEDVELFVYDLSGKVVRVLAERNGSTFIWDGRDSSGHEAPTGTYIIRGVVEDRSATVRFVKL
ncbi:MAG: T9SS type A sorting domain-containing protein [Candidatus Aegiribacteria sp.]|nr:T9SS type A sorting domain-containing protein [Candidatus Aegiribacteria sp.]